MSGRIQSLPNKTQEDVEELWARSMLESLRWPDGPICPHCGCDDVYKSYQKTFSKTPGRNGLYSCAACRKQFSVTVGTVLEGTHMPLKKWIKAVQMLCDTGNNMSIMRLHLELCITYKSAWWVAFRIKYAMQLGL